MQKLESRVRQIGMIDGVVESKSDLISITVPSSPLTPEAHKGSLYILTEPDTLVPHSRQACLLAARTLQRAFYDESTSSITAAMRRAIAAANHALYQENIPQPAGQRATVGLSIAVLKDGELYVAQVQPAQAYVLSQGVLRAFPAHPSWDPAHVSVAPFSRAGALGASLFIEPEFYRCTLRAGETLILCSSSFSPLLTRQETNQILRWRDPDASGERLLQIANEHGLVDAYALVASLEVRRAASIQQETSAPAVPPRPAPLWSGWLARWRPAPQATPPPVAPRPDPLTTLPPPSPYSTNPIARPAPLDIGEDLGTRYARAKQEREISEPELPPSTFLGEENYFSTSRRIDLGDGPELEATARPYRTRYEKRPFVDLTWKERFLLPFRMLWLALDEAIRARRVRPLNTPPAIMRGQGLSYRRNQINIPWLMLLGMSLLIVILILYGMNLTRENDQQLALEYISAAETRLASVREATNETLALESLELARQAIDEVRASAVVTDTNPTLWLRYQEIQREYERALAAVQRVTFIDSPTLISTHPSAEGSFEGLVVPPTTTTITDPYQLEVMRYIYTLDAERANTPLYRIPRDGGPPEPYLNPGTQIGETIVGPMRSALWRIDQVVAVDQAPEGFGYYFRNRDQWNYSKLGGSEIWQVRDHLRIAEYDGNLYVWGAVPNEVLKFNSGSYGDTPEYWLDPASLADVDLSNVVDMTVDGAIYLLNSNGGVLVFSQGRLVSEIKPETITPVISGVTRFFVTNDGFGGGSIFLVEPINARIIQIDKLTGKIIQQIRMRTDSEYQLNQLSDMVVVSNGPRTLIYMLNGRYILRAELPAPPRTFREESATPTPAVQP
ncbi:hypothetical protein [Candidatus Oscillochloris fontis]|uniref:hypothetical protein n=1 Tax=Candidatus Oscillochloris fontis TaxID=2496868 RepID=UPI00101CD8FA|nr:hypothetical protein [Candidatus Oscillochloris fontis]